MPMRSDVISTNNSTLWQLISCDVASFAANTTTANRPRAYGQEVDANHSIVLALVEWEEQTLWFV